MSVADLQKDQQGMGFQSSNTIGVDGPAGMTYATGGSKSGQNDKGAVSNVGPGGSTPSTGSTTPNGVGGSTAAKSGNDIPSRNTPTEGSGSFQSSNSKGPGLENGNRQSSFGRATRARR